MKAILLTIATLFVTISTFANTPIEKIDGQLVRYKGTYYYLTYTGSNYSVLINRKTHERIFVDFKNNK